MKKSYLVTLLLAFVVAWPVAGIVRGIYRTVPCRLDLYTQTNYLASCEDFGFGDLEHQAFYHGLYQTDRRLREADVIFLGDSRVQYAFSRDNVASFFADNRAKFFVAAFGYTEGWLFPTAVLERHNVRPAVLVVNVAPFFNLTLDGIEFGGTSGPAKYVLEHPINSYFDALMMEAAVRFFAAICPTCGWKPVTMRREATGQWDWHSFDPGIGTGQWEVQERTTITDDGLRRWGDAAEPQARKLLAAASARCVVFTQVPHNGPIGNGAFARELGARLDIKVILPKVDGLRTLDPYWHLDQASSVKWSDAFLQELKKLPAFCWKQ
jgi:hypothetical protein